MDAQRAISAVFDSSAWAGTPIEVSFVEGREALDTTYRVEIELTIAGADEDPMLMLGKDGVLTLQGLGERRLAGIVTEVEQLEPLGPDQTRARVCLEPAAALLAISQRSRIFQDQTVPEILDRVLREALGEYKREHELSLDSSYPKREFCVQYRESDLGFVERLAAEEGISYSFDQEGQVERMVLRDRGSFPALSPSTLDFVPRQDAIGDSGAVYEIERVSVPRTTKVSVGEHDWTSPSAPKRGGTGEDRREAYEWGLGRSLTLSDYGGSSYGAHDADRQAKVRLESLARDGVVLSGKSRVVTIAEGHKFTLQNHSSELDGEYLIVGARHQLSSDADGERKDPYVNTFTCIPTSVAYRPARLRAKPKVPSVQTALVTGPAGQEIHTDSHGRVKVQFAWDLDAPGDDTSSCWLRVKQGWAGASWGFEFIPRVGMEVTVHFLHGDPDRPVVGGCLYNSDHQVPYALPENKTRSTIKSQSTPGKNGFNELRFEDLKGKEQIYLHAQSSLDEAVLADHTTNVGGNQTNTVHGDQTQTVDANQRETVDGNQDMTVDGDRTVTVVGSFKEKIDGGEKKHVIGAESETIIAGGEMRLVNGPLSETFSANETRSVHGDQTETILAGLKLHVGGHTETVDASLSQTAGAVYELDSTAAALKVTAGGAITTTGVSGHINGASMLLKCDTRLEIDPSAFKLTISDTTNCTTKVTFCENASLDATGIIMDTTLLKADLFALMLEFMVSKRSLYGLKADVSLTQIPMGQTNQTFTAMFIVVG
jgi:type VI secretion system secreted protein VgrG